MSTKKKNMDVYLAEVFKEFIAIKDDDYKKSQEVFKSVFDQVKKKMAEKCNYFGKYGTQTMYAGSVYDGIKVTKLDEFDMDIVIRLPINYDEGIVIENDQPGFVKLKIESSFDNLDKQPDWEKCHKVTREWRDSEKYLLQNKFRQWMHGTVQKALNDMNGTVNVNGTIYLVKYKESGPAYTLNIENDKGNEEFKLDVDLVPVIRFMLPRWPEGYRMIEESNFKESNSQQQIEKQSTIKEWLVVPKPKKGEIDTKMRNRCWRLSFQEFERDMMKGCQQLKTTIRLVKKLRDSLQMKDIASYYIKTLFLWKIDEMKDKNYWQKKISVIFRVMIEELYNAIKNKNIPYYWHPDNNLIAGLKPTVQSLYSNKLKEVLDSIDSNDVDKLISYLLTTDELQIFKKSEFYQKQLQALAVSSANACGTSKSTSRQESVASLSSPPLVVPHQSDNSAFNDLVDGINKTINAFGQNNPIIDILNALNDKIDKLNNKMDEQNETLKKLEMNINEKLEFLTEKIYDQDEQLKKFEMMNSLKRESFVQIGDDVGCLTAAAAGLPTCGCAVAAYRP